MMNLRTWVCATAFLLFAASCLGQTKLERESRMNIREVHPDAKAFVDQIGFSGKVKWYYEENLSGNSIEAKSKKGGKRYSIEFDTLGRLQDIEVESGYSEIPKPTADRMESGLDSAFICHKIKKIQVQYTGLEERLLALVRDGRPGGSYTTQYEFIVKAKKDKQAKLYEIGFDEDGNILEISEIVFGNTDNLEY